MLVAENKDPKYGHCNKFKNKKPTRKIWSRNVDAMENQTTKLKNIASTSVMKSKIEEVENWKIGFNLNLDPHIP